MRVVAQLAVALATSYIVLNVGFLMFSVAFAQDEIPPMNFPTVQNKMVEIFNGREYSTVTIIDPWKQPEPDSVKLGKGAVLGLQRNALYPTTIEPYGHQAYVSQDAIGSWMGHGIEAIGYGGL